MWQDLRWGCFSFPYWVMVLVVGWVTGLLWAHTWVGVLYYLVPIPLYVAALWWLEKKGWLGAKPGGSSGRPPGSVG